MELVFFICTVLIFISTIFFLITFSYLKINIKELTVNNILEPKIKIFYKIELSLYFLDKIKILKYTITSNSKVIKKIEIKAKESIKYDLNFLKLLKYIKINIEKFNLKLDIGTINVLLNSSIVFIISTAISIFIPHFIKNKNYEDIYYKIQPINKNKNLIDLKFNCIIKLKMVHIINILYMYLSKKGGDKIDGTSNRRSYDNSNEQHSRYGGRKYYYRRAN